MSDLGLVLPDATFDRYEVLIQQLEEQHITSSDLMSIDAVEIAKRVSTPVPWIKQLIDEVTAQLHEQSTPVPLLPQVLSEKTKSGKISLLDDTLDAAIGGGIRPGYITEVVGPSGVGKTQFLFSLLLSVQLPAPHGLGRRAVYIATEHALQTQRLEGMLETNPVLKNAIPKPTLNGVITLSAQDLELQDHVLEFQLPIAVERHNVGLVVIDSIAANYRADDVRNAKTDMRGGNQQARTLSNRSAELIRLGGLLRKLAQKHNCAIVVANQVSDRVDAGSMTIDMAAISTPSSSPAGPPSSMASSQGARRVGMEVGLPANILTLDHQQRWFTGWGDQRPTFNTQSPHDGPALKTPTLGLVWTNQIACRISLHKKSDWDRTPEAAPVAGQTIAPPESVHLSGADWSSRRWRRRIRLAFAPWAEECSEDDPGTEYEICSGGLRSMAST